MSPENNMASCPKCAADFKSLQDVRRTLSQLQADAPRREEIETMWTAIHQTGMAHAVGQRLP